MSLESARAFYERIVTDDAFLTQYQSATNDDVRRDILLTAGYDFTAEEWEAATMAQVSESPDSELSDAELETVSGGILPGGCYSPKLPPKFPPIQPLYGAPIS